MHTYNSIADYFFSFALWQKKAQSLIFSWFITLHETVFRYLESIDKKGNYKHKIRLCGIVINSLFMFRVDLTKSKEFTFASQFRFRYSRFKTWWNKGIWELFFNIRQLIERKRRGKIETSDRHFIESKILIWFLSFFLFETVSTEYFMNLSV